MIPLARHFVLSDKCVPAGEFMRERIAGLGVAATLIAAMVVNPTSLAHAAPSCPGVGQTVAWSDIAALVSQKCDLSSRLVRVDGDWVLDVPERGMMGESHRLMTEPTTLPTSAVVYHAKDGTVGLWDDTNRVSGSMAAVAAGRSHMKTSDKAETSSTSAAAPGCGNVFNYLRHGRRWGGGNWTWDYNGAGYAGDGSRAIILNGVIAMTADSSPCGSYPNSSSTRYSVNTTRLAGVRDGSSVVSFNDIPNSTTLAYADWWWDTSDGLLREGDIRFDLSNRRWFISNSTTGCSNAYDMYTIAVHEAGHIFGLSHWSENSAEVMRPTFNVCEFVRYKRLGDLAGMRSLYP